MRIALVHDWLTGYRGGERVLRHLAERYPDADLFTLIHDRGSVPEVIESLRIHVSPLDRWPGRARHYRKLLPLFPWAVCRFDFSDYDFVLSTSHAVAKSVRVPPGTPHLDYCFTPMRYVWDHREAYLGSGLRNQLASPLVHALRRFDVRSAGEGSVTRFMAISTDVADRIARHYGRAARVVPPPVEVDWIPLAQTDPGEAYLLVGGFVPYKAEAVAIEAFRRSGRRLIVAGDGPTRAALEKSAPANVEFVGRLDEAPLARLYASCRALVYPQREDFGLVAVEAQAAGRPVVAYARGGALDTVVPARSDPEGQAAPNQMLDATGVFFDEQTPEALNGAIERFEKLEARFDPEAIRRWAERFSPARFDESLDQEIEATFRAVGQAAPARAPRAADGPRLPVRDLA